MPAAADKFTVGLIQMRCSADRMSNLDLAIERIREAAKRGAQIISTQELFLSPYFCRVEDADLFDLAESIPGATTEVMAKLARELKVALVVSIFERRAAGIYHNSAAVLDADGSMLGIYRKMHIPDDPSYYENGRVQYGRLSQSALFRSGLHRVLDGTESYKLVLLCAEKEPLACHRTLLVARALVALGVSVTHIHADGSLESHNDAMTRLIRILGMSDKDLYRSKEELIADACALQERRIAYVDEDLRAEASA